MTQIVGKIVDSAGIPFDGELVVTLDSPLVDIATNPDELHVLKSHTFPFSSGLLSGVNLVESQSKNITYHFVVNEVATEETYYLSDGTQYDGPRVLHTDSNYYTGTFYEAGQSQRLGVVPLDIRTLVLDFRAVVPNIASVEFASLIPTGIARDTLPTTVRQVAELITSDQDYVETLRGGPRFKGEYAAGTYYQKDDAVTYAGSSWVWINLDPAAGQTPSLANTTYWQILAEKGEPGGTGGNDVPYDATGWNNANWAPSANAVRDVIETLAKIVDLAVYAPIANPGFTGIVSRNSNPLTGDRSSQMPTTEWIGNEFATIASPALTGNPSAPTQPVSDNSNKLATTKFIADFINQNFGQRPSFHAQKTTDQSLGSGTNTLSFNSELLDTHNAFDPNTSTFIAPVEGWYEFFASGLFRRTTGTTIDAIALLLSTPASATRLNYRFGTTEEWVFLTGRSQAFLSVGQAALLRVELNPGSGATIINRNIAQSSINTVFSGRRIIVQP